MSKELEAYKRLRNNIRLLEENTSLKYFFENDEFHFGEDLDTIETVLKDYEKLLKSHKDLERKYYIETLSIDYKKLKAFEIIKEKKVDVGILCHYDFNYYDYNFLIAEDRRKLTEEEIDLLKGVLK